MTSNEENICFIISAIGEPDSEIRNNANLTFDRIILPIAQKHGYFPFRADHIAKPGMISQQIINLLIDAPLVIADLTYHNPNVFYELAIRHITRKPVIHIINNEQKIPFDVFDFRTIYYNLDDNFIENAKIELDRQIVAIHQESETFENPISIALEQKKIRLLDSEFFGDVDVVFENSNNNEVSLSIIGDFELPSDRIIKKIDAAIERKTSPKEPLEYHKYPGSLGVAFSSALSAATMIERIYGIPNFDSLSLEELEEKRGTVKDDYAQNDLYELFEENSHKINFLVINNGKKYILDVSVKIELPRIEGLLIANKVHAKPRTGSILLEEYPVSAFSTINFARYPDVEYAEDKIIIFSKIGKVKHLFSSLVFEEPIRVVLMDKLKDAKISVKCTIYGENLPEPITRDLMINVD